MTSRCALALVMVAVLATGPAAAAGGRDPAAADLLFRDGRALMKKGDFASACPKLAESQRLDPAPGTAINLGDCVEKLGKLADALQAYRDALDLLPPGDDRIAPVQGQIAALEKRVPKLTINLASGTPKDTRVVRDDVELGTESLGVALPVNPGEHWVIVEAPGRKVARHRVELRAEQARELTVTAGEPAPTGATQLMDQKATVPPKAPVVPQDGSRTTALVLGGIGLAALVFAGVSFYETKKYQQDSDDAHGRGDGDSGRAKYQTAERWQTAGIVSLVGGGAALGIGGVLWLSDSSSGGIGRLRASTSTSAVLGSLLLEGTW